MSYTEINDMSELNLPFNSARRLTLSTREETSNGKKTVVSTLAWEGEKVAEITGNPELASILAETPILVNVIDNIGTEIDRPAAIAPLYASKLLELLESRKVNAANMQIDEAGGDGLFDIGENNSDADDVDVVYGKDKRFTVVNDEWAEVLTRVPDMLFTVSQLDVIWLPIKKHGDGSVTRADEWMDDRNEALMYWYTEGDERAEPVDVIAWFTVKDGDE